MSKKKKSNLVINIEYFLVFPLIKLIQLLPLRAVYMISNILGKLFYLVSKKHRTRTIQHLKHANIVTNHIEAVRTAKEVFNNMAKLGVEIFKLPTVITKDNWKDHISISGSEKAKDMFFTKGQEKQMIIATAHYGNWEFLGKCFKDIFGKPVTAIMRPFDNPKIGELIYDVRNIEGGSTMTSKDGGIRRLLKALRNDQSICLLVDQHASHDIGIETTFFGQPARTHTSPALLHLKTGVPILPLVVRRIDDKAHFEIVCEEPIIYKKTGDKKADIQNITQMITTALENLIRECPEQWMWCHRRWLNINRKSYPKQNDTEKNES